MDSTNEVRMEGQHATIRPGSVTLRVPDLDESLRFYGDLLGLSPVREERGRARLSPDAESSALLDLVEAADAPPPPVEEAGLYHLALRVPERAALARALVELRAAGTPLQGLSDHGVSEAIYLADPHGNGVEIYADRPREAWVRRNGEVEMVTRPLNVKSLLAELEDVGTARWEGTLGPLLGRGTELGHVHLKVTSLEKAEAFYGGVLGIPVTSRTYPGALFFGAGGYHHHVGANVWATRGGSPRRRGSLGVAEISLLTDDAELLGNVPDRAAAAGFSAQSSDGSVVVADGDGIRIRIAPGPSLSTER